MILSSFLYQIIDGGRKEKGYSQRESLEIAQKAGVKNVDINAQMFDSTPVEKVKALLDEFDMTMCVHSAKYCDFSNEDAYNKSLEIMKNDLLNAKKGGSKYLMAVPLLKDEELKPDDQKQREYFFRIFRDLADFGAEMGVCVTVESYSDTGVPYGKISDLKWLLDGIENLYFNLDTGNFTLAGEDALEGAKAFLQKTVNVHVKDVAQVENSTLVRRGVCYDCVALGEGVVQIDKILDLLKDADYKGYLTVEVSRPLFDRTMKSLEYIKDYLNV